jgi:chitin deacetylase
MLSVSSFFVVVSAFAASVSAHPTSEHNHVERGGLPGEWFHAREHFSHSLFRRQDDKPLPVVGSAEWKAKYPPPGQPLGDETKIPKPWLDAYKAAVANGLIAQIPPTTIIRDQDYNSNPVYAKGFDPSSDAVCSTYVQCYKPTDLHEAPAGMIGISFDDGPAEGSKTLYPFLAKNHIKATHFLIGGNIVNEPDLFMQAFKMNGDLAVHTWTHPMMTAQSDLAVLGELGWTMQIIHDSTGGRVPRYWRPAYGDMDQRVRSIAENVFGLTAVLWNKDTNDWAMPSITAAEISKELDTWLSGDKSTGLYVLEHELSEDTANIFINSTWEGVKKYNWKALSVAQIAGKNGFNYANAKDNIGEVTPVTGIETGFTSTGTVPLPTWYSGTASIYLTTTTATQAPATDSAPSAPTTTPGAPAPSSPATTSPAPNQPQQPTSQPSTPGSTDLPNAGGGAGTGSNGGNGNSGSGGNSQTPSNPSGNGQQDNSSGSTENKDNGAGVLRPQFAMTAVVAVLALAFFA